MLPPWQAVGGLAVTVTLGKGRTVSVSVDVFVQPFASIVVTVYVVVVVGKAVGFAEVVLLNPVAGVHEYVIPPVALSALAAPSQMVEGVALNCRLGKGFIVSVRVVELEQPLASVTKTVYVVVAVGNAVGLETVVLLNPVEGVHE